MAVALQIETVLVVAVVLVVDVVVIAAVIVAVIVAVTVPVLVVGVADDVAKKNQIHDKPGK